MSNTPKASRYLTYDGDVTDNVIGQVMGPTTLGEKVTAVSAEFDSTTGKTRVGFAYGIHEVAK